MAMEMIVANFKEWWAWLETFDSTTARIVELRCFAGLSREETAMALDCQFQRLSRDCAPRKRGSTFRRST